MTLSDPIRSDHDRIEAALKSEEWQRKLDQARARRAEILRERGEKPKDGSSPSGAVTGQSDAAPASGPKPSGSRNRLGLGIALGIGASFLGGWVFLAVVPSAPALRPPEPRLSAPAAPDPAQGARLTFGTSSAAVPSQAGGFPVGTGAADSAPAPKPAMALRLVRLAAVAPGTRVHLPADAPVGDLAGGLTLMPSRFASGRNVVRFFHDQDRDLARRAAGIIGAEAADFTAYAPRPVAGTIEVWIAD